MKDKNYSRNIFILFCKPTPTRKHFQDVPSWYLLLDLAALNENIILRTINCKACTETNNKVCQNFNEVGEAVRRDSATELENPMNL